MAIYHFSAQVISRSQGRSVVASAAYRAAEKLVDERTDLTHDYTRKSDVLEKTILLPKDAPKWMGDRSTLWNAVEQSEKRKDAQLARDLNVSLPRELSAEQNWDLLKTFVQREFVDRGMVADVAFHRGHRGEEAQPHGHVLLTMRAVTEDGFGSKVRAWNDRGLLQDWRERWAEHVNLELARYGLDLRIDHRSLAAQGINLEPQNKIGGKATRQHLDRFQAHQALAQRNGERLLADPEIALTALTRQHSTFTSRDIARFVSRHTVDAAQFTQVQAKITAHPELVSLGQDAQQQERFTTRTLLTLEATLLEQAIQKAERSDHAVSQASLTQAMADKNLSATQVAALTHLTQGKEVACLVGFAGTGKSYLLGAAREAWEAQGYRVHGMTLSGIAAEALAQGSGIESHTVASRLWCWERDRERLSARAVVVVDEAGMLGSRQMSQIMAEATAAGAKVVLVGDPEQLQAIEAGAAYRAIAERVGYVALTDIRRQHEAWQQAATRDFACARTAEGLSAYAAHDRVHTFTTRAAAMEGLLEAWAQVRAESPDKTQLMLAYTREEVLQLNSQARALRHVQGELGPDHHVATARGVRSMAEADRIYFLRNENRDLQVKNGTLGTIERIEADRLTVRLDAADHGAARCVEFSLKDYNAIDHGYAATVYKAQGVTVDRTHVLASAYFDRHSTYVAMSRHREGADLYVGREDFPSFDHLEKTLARDRRKDMSLDYALEVETNRASAKTLSLREQIQQALGHSRDAGAAPTRSVSVPDRRDVELAAFKARFEAEHPEQARDLARSVLPAKERDALALLDRYHALKTAVDQSEELTRSKHQRALSRHMDAMAKDSRVRSHLERYAPDLAETLQVRAVRLSKSHSFGLER